MQNKKIAAGLVMLAVVSFFAVTLFALHKPYKSGEQLVSEQPEVTGELPELVCEYENNNDAYKDAFERKEVNQCECIDDEKLRNTCKMALMDLMFYDRALDSLDVAFCEKVLDDTQKSTCIVVVEDMIAQLKEEDAQYLADMYSMTHNEKAIELLEEVVIDDPENIENYVSLALAYAEKGLSEQEKGKDQDLYVQKALDVIESAKKIDDKSSEIYRVEGYVYEIKPDLGAAIGSYDEAIDLDKNNLFAYVGKGHVLRMLGALDDAVIAFNEAARLDANRTQGYVYTNLCNIEYTRSDHEAAIKNCKIVIDIENVDPIFQSEAYQILSTIFIDAGDYAQAKNYLLQAKTITPDDVNLYVALSRLNLYEELYEEAESNARKALEMHPGKTAAQFALANALYMQERYEDSIKTAEQGIAFVDGDVSLLTPSKPSMEASLNYLIANNYRQLGNEQKQLEYEKNAEELYEVEINEQIEITQ